MKSRLAAGALLALSACATPPSKIAPVAMPDDPYAAMSCAELTTAKFEADQAVATVSAQQEKAVTGDAVGVFLIGVPLSSATGGDKETEVAVAKGKADAITRAQAKKGCAG